MFPRRVAIVALILIAVTSAAWAQRFRVMEGPGMPLHMPPAHFSDGAFTICKMMYTSNRREANGFDWSTDYPFAGLNLMLRSSELTKTRISKDSHGDARYWTVHLTDDALFECPFLVGSDVGTIDHDRERRAEAFPNHFAPSDGARSCAEHRCWSPR